jgi:hypothetical protein
VDFPVALATEMKAMGYANVVLAGEDEDEWDVAARNQHNGLLPRTTTTTTRKFDRPRSCRSRTTSCWSRVSSSAGASRGV